MSAWETVQAAAREMGHSRRSCSEIERDAANLEPRPGHHRHSEALGSLFRLVQVVARRCVNVVIASNKSIRIRLLECFAALLVRRDIRNGNRSGVKIHRQNVPLTSAISLISAIRSNQAVPIPRVNGIFLLINLLD